MGAGGWNKGRGRGVRKFFKLNKAEVGKSSKILELRWGGGNSAKHYVGTK